LEATSEKYIFPFQKLEVWSLAVELADFVLRLLERFPPGRYVRLVGQMEAAVIIFHNRELFSNKSYDRNWQM